MKIDFKKMHGTGNDFIVIDDFSAELELTSEQVAQLCDRHFGIGADGVILARPPKDESCLAYMHYINADGSLAEMCGNGIRCFAKFLVDGGFASAHFIEGASASPHATEQNCMILATLAGKRTVAFEVDGFGHLSQATVDMGEPTIATDVNIKTPFGSYTAVPVNMGNPHVVIFDAAFAQDPFAFDVQHIGAHIESLTELFPAKTNVEFASMLAPNEIIMRVWERGVGETLSCGTGACAVAVAAITKALTDKQVLIHLPGGDLHLEWHEDNHVFMTGAAATVFEGTIEI